MAKEKRGGSPKLGDYGGKDATYKPRSRSSDVAKASDGAFPGRGGPKPMLDCNDDMQHLGGKKR